MPKKEWGRKHRCDCGTKIYDLGREQFQCPSCGTDILAVAAEPERPETDEQVKADGGTEAAKSLDDHQEILDDEDDVEMEGDVLDEDSDEVPLDTIANVPTDDDN